jgi:hypothetical protein
MVMDLTYNPDVLKAYDPCDLIWDEDARVLRNVLTNEVVSARPMPSLAQYWDAFSSNKRMTSVGLPKRTTDEWNILTHMLSKGDSRRQYRWTAMKQAKLGTSFAFELATDDTHVHRALKRLVDEKLLYRGQDHKGHEFVQFSNGLYDLVLECAWRWLIREAASALFLKPEVKRLDQNDIARRVDVKFRNRAITGKGFTNPGKAEDRAVVVTEVLRDMLRGD